MIHIAVKKQYSERVVLNVDFSIEEGKRYAIIGSNGSGKSTLLMLLAKIIKPNDGNLSHIYEKNLTYMPQSPYVFNLSLKRNVSLACKDPSKMRDAKRAYYNDRVYTLISKIGLWNLRYKNATKLSGGETQRMALIRNLVQKHDILLLDEPTSAMDIGATLIAEKTLTEYYEEYTPTIIFATHSINQAERFADYIIYLKDGEVKEIADAKTFISNPQSEDLKEFLKQA